MAKERLLMTELCDGVEMYPYFDALIGGGTDDKINRSLDDPPRYDPEKVYYLALPFPVVSPALFIGDARLAVALEMPTEVLREICVGQRLIAEKEVDEKTIKEENQTDRREGGMRYSEDEAAPRVPMYYRWRDCLTVRTLTDEGIRDFDALHYLCERYLDGMVLSEERVVAVRVHGDVVKALSQCENDFLNDPLCEAYAKIALRIARVVKIYHLNAPRIICQNERMMLAKAVVALAENDPFSK